MKILNGIVSLFPGRKKGIKRTREQISGAPEEGTNTPAGKSEKNSSPDIVRRNEP
jgi:hypothetical protein